MNCYLCNIIYDPSFLGTLLGAIITGVIAISVFFFGNRNESKKKEKLIGNYGGIIEKIHTKTKEDFQVFVDVKKNRHDLPKDYKAKIVRLVNSGKVLDEIEVNGLIEVSDQAFYILEYIIAYREAIKLISATHAAYGNIFFDKEGEEGNQSEVEWLEEYIKYMNDAMMKIK